MKFIKRILFFVFASSIIVSCTNDKANNQTNDKSSSETEVNSQQQADPHAGHNHGDDDNHNHSSEPRAIENDSRVSVPAGKSPQKSVATGDKGATRILSKEEMQAEYKESLQSAVINLPEPCGLLSDRFIAQALGVEKDAITLKDGSNRSSPYARSCFFRWDHRGIPNSGVFIQVQDNPLPDEFPEWAPYYIKAKRDQGEKSPDGSINYRYKNFEGLGIDGAYSYDLHRYIWRDAYDYVYLVGFNLPATESEELAWAKVLGAEVMKNAKLKR